MNHNNQNHNTTTNNNIKNENHNENENNNVKESWTMKVSKYKAIHRQIGFSKLQEFVIFSS